MKNRGHFGRAENIFFDLEIRCVRGGFIWLSLLYAGFIQDGGVVIALDLRLIQELLCHLNNVYLLIHFRAVTVKELARSPSARRVQCARFLDIDFLHNLAHLIVEGLLDHVILYPQVFIEVLHTYLRSVRLLWLGESSFLQYRTSYLCLLATNECPCFP